MCDDRCDDVPRDPAIDPAWLTNQIAHALHNQIFAAQIHAEVLQQRVKDDPILRQGVETLFAQVKRLESTIQEMLLYGREVPVERSSVRVRGLLEEIAAEYRQGRRVEAAEVTVEANDALTARWDPRGVRIILERLLDNAVQHSPVPHTIELTASRRSAEILLTVEDRGEGVAEGADERIFQPFYPQHQGRIGLGLAVARRFARALGGDLSLAPRSGGGTRACCHLPAGNG